MARKTLEGIVVSDRMDRTRTVEIVRKFKHPLYEKVMVKYKKVYAHDESNTAHTGDKVRILESRPISKLKRWRIVKVLGK